MRTIHLTIEAGARTCAAAKGTFCRFLRVSLTGSGARCALYGGILQDTAGDGTGSILRAPECLASDTSPERSTTNG